MLGWAMEFLTQDQFKVLSNPGIISVQLLCYITLNPIGSPLPELPSSQKHSNQLTSTLRLNKSGLPFLAMEHWLLDEGKTQVFQREK